MDTAELASIIITVGALVPLLTSIVEQRTWTTRTRTLVGIGISALAGLVTYVTQFGLNFSDPGALVTTVVGVILAAGTAYKTVWQPSGVAPALEHKSSPTPVTPDPADAEGGGPEEEPEIDLLDEEDVPEDAPEGLEQPFDFDDGAGPQPPRPAA